jgi:hypothetical protein
MQAAKTKLRIYDLTAIGCFNQLPDSNPRAINTSFDKYNEPKRSIFCFNAKSFVRQSNLVNPLEPYLN